MLCKKNAAFLLGHPVGFRLRIDTWQSHLELTCQYVFSLIFLAEGGFPVIVELTRCHIFTKEINYARAQ